MISLETIATFVTVAETLSVTQTAKTLNIAKGLVSKRIGQLETHLGATLFSRSTRRIALTPTGEAYLPRALKILAEMRAAEEEINAMRHELVGKIRLTAPVSWGQRVLAKSLPKFLLQHPGIEIELTLSDRLVDMAYEGFDIALRWSAEEDLLKSTRFELSRIVWLLAAAPGFLNKVPDIKQPKDLASIPSLFYWKDPSDHIWKLQRGKRLEVVEVASRYHVDNPEAVLTACLEGLGVALVPDYLCREALETGQLVQVLPQWTPITRFGTRITALCPPERERLPRNAAMLTFLTELSV